MSCTYKKDPKLWPVINLFPISAISNYCDLRFVALISSFNCFHLFHLYIIRAQTQEQWIKKREENNSHIKNKSTYSEFIWVPMDQVAYLFHQKPTAKFHRTLQ